ncbi:isoprenylcysteine carboxylmethyltransferase family protein [uncultured Dokdonia sp.]|uniref:methyltransferase family protein n=1 Tax=uncultured Dokdonia sp. TaxID=575653 RepID=UPI002602B644|nr:isoprenylcysteine carboxylmethyltransferase family protein [uncultured Dokdonia sp.]
MKLQTADITFVLIQFVLFFLFILDNSLLQLLLPSIVIKAGIMMAITGLITIGIALLQLNKNLSPFPSPKSGSQLIQSGLYNYIRHPIYTGILLLFTGYSFYISSGYKLLITIGLLVLFIFKSRYEEKRLTQTFKEYSNYKKSTGRFLPKINR